MKKKNKLFWSILLLGIICAIAIVAYNIFSDSEPDFEHSKNVVTTYRSLIKNDPYNLQVAVGKRLTGKPFQNSESVEKAEREGKISAVRNSKGVIIDDLTHSIPYLHPKAAQILIQIGKEFNSLTDGDNLIVTSLTRPIDNQKALTKTNPNASPNTSTHSYGVSFDIAYTKFNRKRQYNHDAHRAIDEILKRLQKEKKIFVIREKLSACYHITVR